MSGSKKIDVRSLARLITGLESRDKTALKRLSELPRGRSDVIGITGPPGAGKSTIADGMIKLLRKKGARVGVVAIDPSSPFSGGALLGDRIRMQEHAGDYGVFIRSVGSRGSHGGLSRATRDIVNALIGHGFNYVIVETVGVGQTELDIMEIADVTVVVLVPESGDMIQTMKAGLLEIADIFVVNKADRAGAEQMQNWLIGMFDSGDGLDAEAVAHHGAEIASKAGKASKVKSIPVLLTQANRGIGFNELMTEISKRLKFIKNDKVYRERKKQILRQEFLDMCADEFKARLSSAAMKDKDLKKLVTDIETGKKGLYETLKMIDKFVRFGK